MEMVKIIVTNTGIVRYMLIIKVQILTHTSSKQLWEKSMEYNLNVASCTSKDLQRVSDQE